MNIIIIFLFFKQKRVENFTDNKDNLCSLYVSQPKELDNKCNSLTETNCNTTSCCVWLNGNKCVAGGSNGPTFHTTNGKPIDIKYYSYQGKLYGNNLLEKS